MSLSKKTYFFLFSIIFLAGIVRLTWLDKYPLSLYSDEADQGYNAYSILQTGRDEHGTFLPVSLRSFGDWKPPLPSVLMIPPIWIMGLSEVSVRLPSALLGIASVILIFFLTKELFASRQNNIGVALLSAFFLAISPWHILQSRAAMLVAVGLFFFALGIYLFLKSLKKKSFLILSSAAFALSIYSYYGLRVATPLILLFLLIKYKKSLILIKKELVLSMFIGFILLLPLFISFIKQPDVIFGRAKTVSIFYDQGINLRKWELISGDGMSANTVITRFFHNNLYMYGKSIIQRFTSHLDANFLLITGDRSPPFQIPGMGVVYFPDIFLILAGAYFLYKNKFPNRGLLVFWIIAAILPAALTYVTPSANRIFNTVAVYSILTAIAVGCLKGKTVFGTLWFCIVSVIYVLSFGYFLRQYFLVLPQDHADWWNYGWKQAVEYVKSREVRYQNIVVPDVYGMPYVYFLFYGKYPPSAFQKNAIRTYVADRFGYEHIEGFDKYLFPADFDWKTVKKYNLAKDSLYVLSPRQAPEDTDYIKAIYYPNGKIAFKIFAYAP